MYSFEFPTVVPSLLPKFQDEMDKAIADNLIEPNCLRIAQIVNGKNLVTRFSCDGHLEISEEGPVHAGLYLMFAVQSMQAFTRLVGVCGTATRKLQDVSPYLYMELRISTALHGKKFYPCVILDVNHVGYDDRAIPAELAEPVWAAVHSAFVEVFGEPACV